MSAAEIMTAWEYPPDLEVQMIIGQIESGMQELCKMIANGNPAYVDEMLFAQNKHDTFGKMFRVSEYLRDEMTRATQQKRWRIWK